MLMISSSSSWVMIDRSSLKIYLLPDLLESYGCAIECKLLVKSRLHQDTLSLITVFGLLGDKSRYVSQLLFNGCKTYFIPMSRLRYFVVQHSHNKESGLLQESRSAIVQQSYFVQHPTLSSCETGFCVFPCLPFGMGKTMQSYWQHE